MKNSEQMCKTVLWESPEE